MLVLLLVILLSVFRSVTLIPQNIVLSAGKTAGQQRPRQFRSLSKKCVPYFLASSDVLFGLASGMTIKFFPIFFLKQVALPPIGTNFILAGTPLCVAIMSQLASPIAQLLGELTLLLLWSVGHDSCCCVSRVMSVLPATSCECSHVCVAQGF